MEIEENVFTGKTVEDAVLKGLAALNIAKEDAEIVVIDEGKKKLFGSVPAKVKVTLKKSDGVRATEFVDGLLEILGVKAVSELKSDGDKIEIEIQTTNSHAVIGRRGEILDAIQCVAGAVANIGRDDYRKVVVDCENYREHREQTLKALADKLAKKAVERGRKVTLEPMNPYERRIIHSALADNTEVKTVSDGKEPNRFVVIIPNNLKPYERRERSYGDRKPYGDRRGQREKRPYAGRNYGENVAEGEENAEGEKKSYGERSYGDRKPYGDRRGQREKRPYGDRRDGDRGARPARPKKQIYFGTYLGNSNSGDKTEGEENTQVSSPAEDKSEE